MKKTNELTINRTLTIPAKGKHCHGNSKAILLVEDGEVYFSMADVAETLEVSRPAISQSIKHGYKLKGKTPILVANLPYKVNLLCEVIKTLNQRNRALEADTKGMEAEISSVLNWQKPKPSTVSMQKEKPSASKLPHFVANWPCSKKNWR